MRNALFGSRHCPIGTLGDGPRIQNFLDRLMIANVTKEIKTHACKIDAKDLLSSV